MLKIEYWFIAILILIAVLAGIRQAPVPAAQTHRVIIEGGDDGFHNVKSSYKTGETVDINYDLIATDVDYSFTVDGEAFSPDYDSERGYVFRFTMPDHDVEITWSMESSMMWMPTLDKNTMLFDYYEATVATVGGDEYKEWVLYACQYEEDWIGIVCYTKYEDDPETESDPVIVPATVLDELMEVAGQYDMAGWEEMDGIGLNGKYYSVRYPVGEDFVHVTSDNMPEDGRQAFYDCRDIITRAMSEEGVQ